MYIQISRSYKKKWKNNGNINISPVEDTLCLSYVIDASRTSHKLDNLALDYLNYNTIKFEDICGSGSNKITFDEVKINLPQEKQFIIKTENNSDSNIYIQSVKLNGENYNYSYITHKDIMKGGELVFEMGSIPNKSFANDKEFRPKSKMY